MFSTIQMGHQLDFKWNNKLLVSYQYPKDGKRGFWHPLQLPDSPPLTVNRPSDHVHHQGMWLAWKKVNGVNFWEEPASNADSTGFGRVVQQLICPYVSDDQCGFSSTNLWIDWQDKSHLVEKRSMKIYSPTDCYMLIDVDFELKALEHPVILDLQRGEPGQGGCFYSGLTIRFDNRLNHCELLDANGRTEANQIFGQSSHWCGWSGVHTSDGKTYSVTIIDQLKNPNYPTPWWIRNESDYGLLHPSPTYYQPIRLAAAESVLLSYRVVVQYGSLSAKLINRLAKLNF